MASYKVTLQNSSEGLNKTIEVPVDQYILDAAEEQGIDLPYSCRSGGCLVCTARRTEGRSEMGEQYVLEDEHEDEGFTLLCCTTITEPCHFISHQEGEVE